MADLIEPKAIKRQRSGKVGEVKKAGPRYTFIVRGDGFLYKQVRSMVGFLLSVGKGNERPEAVKELLKAAAPRTARVETAPARGLFLWKVFY